VRGRIAALGVASFGPIDLDARSPTHGFITTTPEPGWRNTDLLGPLRDAMPGIPVGFDTDVNGGGAVADWCIPRWATSRCRSRGATTSQARAPTTAVGLHVLRQSPTP
jgi:hypothetical protein